MKQRIKIKLRRYPRIFNILRKVYTSFSNTHYTLLQKKIMHILKWKDSIFFVQIGSNDGLQGDPLHDIIITNKKWKGIFIEPVGYLFERLQRNYRNQDRFIFEKEAIAPSRGVVKFFYVSEKAKAELGDALPYWYDQLGSFDKNHILKQLEGMLEPYILTEEVITVPLQEVLDKHKATKVDLIHIDTEGYDYKVLSMIDFSKYKPFVILYEHMHLSDGEKKAAETLLKQHGYSCIQYDNDTLATIKN